MGDKKHQIAAADDDGDRARIGGRHQIGRDAVARS